MKTRLYDVTIKQKKLLKFAPTNYLIAAKDGDEVMEHLENHSAYQGLTRTDVIIQPLNAEVGGILVSNYFATEY